MFILLEYQDNLMSGGNGHIAVWLFDEVKAHEEAEAKMSELTENGLPLSLYQAEPITYFHDDAAIAEARRSGPTADPLAQAELIAHMKSWELTEFDDLWKEYSGDMDPDLGDDVEPLARDFYEKCTGWFTVGQREEDEGDELPRRAMEKYIRVAMTVGFIHGWKAGLI